MNFFIYLFIFFSLVTLNAQPYFQDVAGNVGISDSSYESNEPGSSSGISFFDFNGDDLDDISIGTTNGHPIKFYQNMGNANFQLVNLDGIDTTCKVRGIVWVDYDNDGDYDLTAGCVDESIKLYRNDGQMNFTNVVPGTNLDLPNHDSWTINWHDVNNDGVLDLFVSSRDLYDPDESDHLYFYDLVNDVFIDKTSDLGLHDSNLFTLTASFVDYNNDGLDDLLLANDKYTTSNILYKKKLDGTFEDASEGANYDYFIDGMSTSIGDFDRDSYPDVYITNTIGGNIFLHNNGEGTFTNIAPSTGTVMNSYCWGASFLDIQNNGNLDLYVSSQFQDNSGLPTSALFVQSSNGNFTEQSNAVIGDNGVSKSNAIGDYNNDGYPDIAVLNYEPFNSLLLKNLSADNSKNWLKVKLEGTSSNIMGIGAKIKISSSSIGEQYNYVLCGEGSLTQNSAYEFFGIDSDTIIDYLKVTWPSGIVDSIPDISPNQKITILEGGSQLSNIGFKEHDKFSVLPNPAIKRLSIRSEIPVFETRLLDMNGKILKDLKLKGKLSAEISVEDLKQGVYFLKARLGDEYVTEKIIKK